MKKLLLVSILCILFKLGFSQSFTATYNFGSVTSSSGLTDPTTVPTGTNVTFGSFTSTGASANPNAGSRFSFTGWPTGATNGSNIFTGALSASSYYQVTVTPAAGYSLTVADLAFTLQRSASGIRQYAVRSSIDNYASNLPASIAPINSDLSVVATNIFEVSDGTSSAEEGSKITLSSSHAAVNGAITFRFYGFNAEGTGGTFSIDNVQLKGSVDLIPTNGPVINVTPAIVNLKPQITNSTSATESFIVTANNLTNDISVNIDQNFEISLDNSTFGTASLNIAMADLGGGANKTVFVRHLSNAVLGKKSGTITLTSTGATDKTLTLNAYVINPFQQDFNEADFLTSSGWTQVNVSGPANSWIYSSQNPNSAPGSATMNGFSDTNTPSNDWLISPALNLNSFANFPVLQFYSREFFTGPDIKLMVSTTYNGSGVINESEWTEINGDFPTATGIWKLSSNIDLSDYKSASTYVAFVYKTTSGGSNNTSEWKIDDFKIENLTQYANIPAMSFEFEETMALAFSASKSFMFKSAGYGDVSVTAPADFQVSGDNILFLSSITINQTDALAGKTVHLRFAPTTRKLKTSGVLTFTATGLINNTVGLSGSSVLRSETIDIASYNLEFFGTDVRDASNIEFGPTNDALQITNVSTVIQKLNMDILAVQEVSDDDAFNTLKTNTGYSGLLSDRWSYSFNTPSSNFPAQKVGFLYNPATTTLISSEALFVTEFDNARANQPNNITNYPGGDASSFWSSGRLPFMATFDVTIEGVTNRYKVIVLHAKSGSATADYNRRVYDVNYLNNYLNTTYPNDKLIILGDFNDKVVGSISTNPTSSYNSFVADETNYLTLTKEISQVVGAGTFVGGSNPSFIDHIITSNELKSTYVSNSTMVEDARNYISSYSTNTSDHLPVYARFTPIYDATLPIILNLFDAKGLGNKVELKWSTLSETKNSHFEIQRSSDGKNFVVLGKLKGAGTSKDLQNYQFTDYLPFKGINYYRLKQVDFDGNASYSSPKALNIISGKNPTLFTVYPNPVEDQLNIIWNSTTTFNLNFKIMGTDGRVWLTSSGSLETISTEINQKLYSLNAGIYILEITADGKTQQQKLIKQ
ncbi:T9SS type A sorting domain-containing protein [Pedobacter alpinus]|uniref:T9SS type A sorting domain-containing protein n=1 Tax=Pedobacter alpinus TaxID=1590643 RepID=A0ABW5TT59_9SPHI